MFDYSARPELLKDRVILVTGAGRGIGAAAAKTYAAHGATVLLLGKTEANLTQVYDEIEAAGHPQPAVIPFNLETALPHQYDVLAAMIESEFGHLDGLLHNASIIGPRTPIEQLSGENFMRVMHVNVNAMFMLTSTLLPLLKLSQDASVVFTSSSVGRKGRAYWGAYGVSKFATEGLMQTLADEVDTVAPVRSNSINPGATRTSMLPDVPTFAEAGLQGLVANNWWGVYLPAKTPKAVVDSYMAALKKAMADPDLKERFAGLGVEAMASSQEEFATFLAAENAKYTKLVADNNIKAE